MPAKVRCDKATSRKCPDKGCRHRQWHAPEYRCTDPDTCWLTRDGSKTMQVKCLPKK